MTVTGIEQTIRKIVCAMQDHSVSWPDKEEQLVKIALMDIHQVFHELGRIIQAEETASMKLHAAYLQLVIHQQHTNIADLNRATDYFRKTLLSGDLEDRRYAVGLLGQLQNVPTALQENLRAMLDDSDGLIGLGAACALLSNPDEIEVEAIYKLGKALKGNDLNSRQIAAMGLAKFRGDPIVIVAFLKQELDSQDEQRLIGICTIAEHATSLQEHTRPVLVELLSKDAITPIVRHAAIHALGQFDEQQSSNTILMPLQQAIAQKQWDTASLLVAQAGKHVLLKGEIVPLIRQMLKEECPAVLSLVILALGEWETGAEPLIPDLLELLRSHGSKQVVHSLVISLSRMGQTVIPKMVALLHEDDIRSSLVATSILSRMAFEQTELVIGTLLEDHDPEIQEKAASLLVMLGPKAARSVPVIRALLEKHDPRLVRGLMHALHRMGVDALPALPDLVKILKASQDDEVLALAVSSLAKMGNDGLQTLHAVMPELPEQRQADVREIMSRNGQITAMPLESVAPDEETLLLFTLYAEMEEQEGIASFRTLAKRLASAQEKGLYPELNGVTANFIMKKFRKLEVLLSKLHGKRVQLLSGKERQKKCLSSFGSRFVPEARRILLELKQSRNRHTE